VAVPPVEGRSLDVDGAVEAVEEQWLREDEVELPVEVEEVETTEQDVREAVREIAAPAVAAPVVLDAGGQELVVPPAAVAAALTVVADDEGTLGPRLDPAALHTAVAPALASIGTPARDAGFDLSSGAPVVVPSVTGETVSPEDLSSAVLGVLTDPAPRRAAAPLTPAEPALTTQEAQALGVKEVIGTFTSRHPCCAPRVTNIHRIADLVDGHVVLPGERFDLNEITGPRDRARGFVDAPQILEGEFVDRIGGGISQFVTTMFNAVFFSGLKDVEHVPHSYYISRYPPGREATISYPEPDFVFENDSPHGVLVDTSYTGTSITVTFWGTKRFDEVRSVTGPRTRLRDFDVQYVQRDDCTATDGEQGFDIVVTREFVKGGRVVAREPFRTRYKPEPKFVCGPPPD
jgi:vancomycin resistance protein YoaR